MSRVAKNPIQLPSGVEVALTGQALKVKGPKGELHFDIDNDVQMHQDGQELTFTWSDDDSKHAKRSGSKNKVKKNVVALAGTTRAIVNNMVMGVSQGFQRSLKMVGVGYRAQAQGNKLNVSAGFSHPVVFDVPQGITIETPSQTEIVIKGIDKQLVGQVAANIRGIRPPEPYKGKGIRYTDEHVAIKETKKK
ncbi:MAG: 50S ribosomal protein L6 [Gammaproteobacteria bacterium CG11_big_fil_rev_8_21_14_0_20_46_22]|nr:MAG: 50S ribosomal protein L6 [Gammaproteobacteria bacterium CG12_big_fil_rev_8_21_14_0_65_46_12]PIR11322.1 MAG: 50S ribosomal protein L6 [Gammaproteobacteria bacterium CG11_big_fil_rev_8_21_14_0_20_46_22]